MLSSSAVPAASRALLALLVSLGVLACSPGAADTARGVEAPVAEVNGQPVTRAEMEEKAGGDLERLRDEMYQAQRRAIDEIVVDRLLEQEAKSRGLTREQLLTQEVDQKVTPPTAAEVQALYDENKDRIGPRTLEEVRPRIVAALLDERRAERARLFREELRGRARVTVTLEQPRTEVQIPAEAPVLGPEKARVTIVEFSDYLCPYCQRAETAVSQVLDRYEGRVRFVHQDFLLGRPRSLPVARSAHCAGDQARFWEYRQDLLSRPSDYSDADLLSRAVRLGLDAGAFRTCLASDRHDAKIRASSQSGQELGVQATPTFFVNGKRMQGVKTVDDFEQLVEAELAGG